MYDFRIFRTLPLKEVIDGDSLYIRWTHDGNEVETGDTVYLDILNDNLTDLTLDAFIYIEDKGKYLTDSGKSYSNSSLEKAYK